MSDKNVSMYMYVGVIGSGKDYRSKMQTVINQVKKIYTFHVSFADNVRNFAFNLVNVNIDSSLEYDKFKKTNYVIGNKTYTGRELLEYVGNTMRKYDENIWVNSIANQIKFLVSNNNNNNNKISFVISDCRFENEVKIMKELCDEMNIEFHLIFCNYKSKRYEVRDVESERLAKKILDLGIYKDGDEIYNLFK